MSSTSRSLRRDAGSHTIAPHAVPLLAASILVVYPLGLMVMNSFKDTSSIVLEPLAPPSSLSLSNYIRAWQQANFGTYTLNSVIVTVASVGLILVVSSMASFVLARYDFPWTDAVYLFFVLGLVMPVRLAVVPLFVTLRMLGLLDTLAGLILVYTASSLPFAVFVLTNYFRSISRELDDAARVDGASDFRIFWQLCLPLTRPGLTVIAIYSLVLVWNDYFFPLVFIHNPTLRTLPLGIASFFGEHMTEWDLVFAGLTLSALPVTAVFVLLSRQFVAGLSAGAVK